MRASHSLECTFVVIQTTICLRFNTPASHIFRAPNRRSVNATLVCGCSISESNPTNEPWPGQQPRRRLGVPQGQWMGHWTGRGVGDTCIIVRRPRCKYSNVIELIYLNFLRPMRSLSKHLVPRNTDNRTSKKCITKTNSRFYGYSFCASCSTKQTNNRCREICIKNALKLCVLKLERKKGNGEQIQWFENCLARRSML